MRNKYYSKKISADGMIFDSKKEYKRWNELRMLEKSGRIRDLKRQVKFVLIPAQREPDTRGPKGGIKPGRLLEREVAYIADFTYVENLPFADEADTGVLVVEDTKGMRTKDYIIKRKLMLYIHGIRIREV
jgi:hypothetical protein